MTGRPCTARTGTTTVARAACSGGSSSKAIGRGLLDPARRRLDVVEARTVFPEDLAARLVTQRQPQKLLHRLGERAVGVRIVGRDDEVVGAHLVDDVDRRRLVHVERDVALTLEVLARRHRELVLAAGAELVPLIVEAPQPPVE